MNKINLVRLWRQFANSIVGEVFGYVLVLALAIFVFIAAFYLLISLALAPSGRWICMNDFDCADMNMKFCITSERYSRDECLQIAAPHLKVTK